jgi:hypothetical protein
MGIRCTRLKRTNTMTFVIHTMTKHGWTPTIESNDMNDPKFNDNDRWAFNHILTEGIEYVQMGDTMWDVWEDDNEQ